ncbi:MAG: hypothetical protein AAF578_13020 [Pseudomonadota bacterium]
MTQSTMRTGAPFTFGPIPIPRNRQIAQDIFRIYSIKAGMRVVTCESGLEALAIYDAEANPNITWLCEQPLQLNQPIGKRPQYTFDLALQYDVGDPVHLEIKPSTRLVQSANGQKAPPYWDKLKPVCENWGFNIDFRTELDYALRSQLITNWRTLLPFASVAYRDPDEELETRILNLSSRRTGVSIRQVCAAEPDQDSNTVIASIARLLHQGRLSAPLNEERVTPNMILTEVLRES